MESKVLRDLADRASEAIANGEQLVHDMAASFGQLLRNIRHMRWFKLAVMRAITEQEAEYKHLQAAFS